MGGLMPGMGHTRRHAAGVLSNALPLDLIVLLNDTSIPSGWTRFSAADDKFIIGAGLSHNAGDTGGADTVTASVNSGTAGAHEPNGMTTAGGGTGSANKSDGSDGPHYHTISLSAEPYLPEYQNSVFI